MRMKGLLLGGLLIGGWMAIAAPCLRAQPERVLLDPAKDFGKKGRPAVSFPHDRHVEVTGSCKECHHRYEQGRNVLDESQLEEGGPAIRCASCHPSKSHLGLERAFHDQCMGCHRKLRHERKKTGPRYCGECHRRP